MQSKFLIVLIIALVGVGGWYVFQQRSPSTETAVEPDMGSYAYICENGSRFSMTPSETMASVMLTASAQGMFTGTITLNKIGDGNRYEGGNVVFSGAGEEVSLSVGNESTVCNPVPSTDMAPWNWGDPGEGGGVKQDVVTIVTENVIGTWQSIDDSKFVREFKAGDVVIDRYEGEEVTSGLWVVFTKETGVEVAYPLDENAVYLQITMTGSQADTLYFKVNKVTPDELELTYLDRGGVLRFRSVQ